MPLQAWSVGEVCQNGFTWAVKSPGPENSKSSKSDIKASRIPSPKELGSASTVASTATTFGAGCQTLAVAAGLVSVNGAGVSTVSSSRTKSQGPSSSHSTDCEVCTPDTADQLNETPRPITIPGRRLVVVLPVVVRSHADTGKGRWLGGGLHAVAGGNGKRPIHGEVCRDRRLTGVLVGTLVGLKPERMLAVGEPAEVEDLVDDELLTARPGSDVGDNDIVHGDLDVVDPASVAALDTSAIDHERPAGILLTRRHQRPNGQRLRSHDRLGAGARTTAIGPSSDVSGRQVLALVEMVAPTTAASAVSSTGIAVLVTWTEATVAA